jgi:hypothetical protein
VSRARDAMRRHEVLAAGGLSGVLGGIAMMAVAMVGAAAQDLSPEYPLAIIGDTFAGSEGLDGPAARAAIGAAIHLAISAGVGVVFAAIVAPGFPTGCAMGLGAGLTLFFLGFMMSAVVPWASPDFREASHVIGGTWVIAHAVFGVTLGAAPALRRWIRRDASEAASRGAALVSPATPVAPADRA